MKGNMDALLTLGFLILVVSVVMFVFCLGALLAGVLWGWSMGYHTGTERSMCVHLPYMDDDDDDGGGYEPYPNGPYDPMRVKMGEQN